MACDKVSFETASKAVDALLKWRNSQSETRKPKLFDQDDEFVYLILTMKKIPSQTRVNPHKVPLPHSLLSPFSEQCLILDDRPNKARVTKAQAQSKVQAESIPIAKILKLSKLASDYRPFEAKRKLCNSYDLFFAEKSIVPLLPRLLGKSFFKKRKLPVPLDLKKSNWKEQVERASSSAMLFIRTGTCSVVKVAKVGMERDAIMENVVAAIEGVVDLVPKKWRNVRSLHLKLLESVALPVYSAVPDVKLKIEGVRDEEESKKKSRKVKDEEVRDSGRKKKKGRIHEVQYMDENVAEEDEIENELGSDGDDNRNDEVVEKKRKKGGLSGAKGLKKSSSDKEKKKKVKEVLIGGSESELVVLGEESRVKVKKGSDSDSEMLEKKRKKGVFSPAKGLKKLSGAEEKKVKEGLIVGSESELAVMDEESGVKLKKKRSGDVKLKAKVTKSVKTRKSKKVA